MTKPQDSVPPHDPAHDERRGPPPVGTLAVVATLILSISTLWLLVLGILEGRA